MKRLLLLGVSIIISLLIAEVALRIVFPQDNKYYVWQPDLHHIFHPDSNIFYGIKGDKEFTINSNGARGDVFTKNTKNYICIGGSTTECLYLDDTETWHNVLQHELGDEYVISSIGKSGITTREHYLHTKYTIPKLEYVNGVILMVGINDLMKRLSRDTLYDANFEFTKQVEDSLVNTIFLNQREQEGVWWRRTALFHLAQRVYRANKQQGVTWENVQDDTGSSLKQWRKNRKESVGLLDTLPDLTEALNEYERNLQLIYSEAKAQKLELICVSQAALYKDTIPEYENALLWMGGIGAFQNKPGHVYYSTKALRQALDMYNQRLKQFSLRNGIHFLDVNAAMPRDTSVFYDDCHFNQNGAQLLGRYIAKELRK